MTWLAFQKAICCHGSLLMSSCLIFISQFSSFLASPCSSNCTTFFSQLCSFWWNSLFSSSSCVFLWAVSWAAELCIWSTVVWGRFISAEFGLYEPIVLLWEVFPVRLWSCFPVGINCTISRLFFLSSRLWFSWRYVSNQGFEDQCWPLFFPFFSWLALPISNRLQLNVDVENHLCSRSYLTMRWYDFWDEISCFQTDSRVLESFIAAGGIANFLRF